MNCENGVPVALISCGYIELIRGRIMDAKFDIFKRLPDGHPLWVKAVEGLEEAKSQLARMAVNSPGEYFIYSVRNACIVHAKMVRQG